MHMPAAEQTGVQLRVLLGRRVSFVNDPSILAHENVKKAICTDINEEEQSLYMHASTCISKRALFVPCLHTT